MKYWLRWLVVFPAAMAAGILVLIPVHFVLYRSLTGSGLITPYPELPERLLSPFFAACAFVWAGTYVSPSHKSQTAKSLVMVWIVFVFAGIGITLSGVSDRLTFTTFDAARMVVGTFGAYIGYHYVRDDLRDSHARTSVHTGKATDPVNV